MSYVEYISLIRNKMSDQAGCDDFEIDRRYSEDIETSYLMMKWIVRLTLTIIYVVFYLLCML